METGVVNLIQQAFDGNLNARVDLLRLNRVDVVREINRMIGADMADVALKAAVLLQNETLAGAASRVVLLSGSYAKDIRQLAAKHNRDLDLTAMRATVLNSVERR